MRHPSISDLGRGCFRALLVRASWEGVVDKSYPRFAIGLSSGIFIRMAYSDTSSDISLM